jgi:TonB family protein
MKRSHDSPGSFEGYAQRAAQRIERQIASVAKPGTAPVQSITYSVAIQSNGAIQSVRIMRPSGDNELDAKAVAAIKAAAPFEPFPEALRGKGRGV